MNICAGSLNGECQAIQLEGGGLNPTPALHIKKIPNKQTYPWLLLRHYAKRIPSISFSFGAFRDGKLIGVVTYGTPSSSPLRLGIAGPENSHLVLELNRLCCENEKNVASQIVSHSIRLLPRPRIIVSYADTEQHHIGYVYQACNFLYTGLSAKRTDWKIRGQENLHGQTVADESRGHINRAAYMRTKYGERFYLAPRSRKHRYIYFCAAPGQKLQLLKALRYPTLPYPK